MLLMAGVTCAFPIMQQEAKASVSAGDIVFDDYSTHHIKLRDSGGSITDIGPGNQPDVSPDGSRIAFIAAASGGGGSWTLHVMNSDGSDATELVPRDTASNDNGTDSTVDQYPNWSPDGQWIVFNRVINRGSDGNYWEIDKVRADGTGLSIVNYVVQTSASYRYETNPTWSPSKDGSDGSYRVAFVSNQGDGSTQLYIVDSSGDNLHQAGTTNQALGGPVWSLDGSRIYFGGANIYYFSSTDSFVSSDGTVSLLQSGANVDSELRLSADGSTLLYSDSYTGVYTLSTSGSGSPSLLPSSSDERDPTYVSADWPNGSTKTLVALGDSVAAGEGINYGFVWDSTTDKWVQNGPASPGWMDTTPAIGDNYPGCHQSGKGFPNLIALNDSKYRVYNMACTGASALQNSGLESGGVLDREILGDGTSPPAQLGGSCAGCASPSTVFDGHNPDAVTLTLGANDINFANWLKTCYYPATRACNTTANKKTLNSQLSVEKSDLRIVLRQLNIWAAGKNKMLTVLVTDYYNPFPRTYVACIDTSAGVLQGTYPGIGITSSEQSWLVSGLHSLNQNIHDEVGYARSKDSHLSVRLVDLSGDFGGSDVMAGHKFCDSSPWVHGISIDYPSIGGGSKNNPAPFHPTSDGQRAIYTSVVAALP